MLEVTEKEFKFYIDFGLGYFGVHREFFTEEGDIVNFGFFLTVADQEGLSAECLLLGLVNWSQNLVRVLSMRHILISFGLPLGLKRPVRMHVYLRGRLALHLLLALHVCMSVHA